MEYDADKRVIIWCQENCKVCFCLHGFFNKCPALEDDNEAEIKYSDYYTLELMQNSKI